MDVRADVLRTNDFLRTKLFWMRRLPDFLTLCAPLRALCARESSAITLLSNEAYDCQKVAICCSVAGVGVRRLIFVIKTREDWVIIKHTPSRQLSVHITNPFFMYYYYLLSEVLL